MDVLDRRLLRLMQEDGRLSNRELAGRVGLSEAQCSRRVSALYERGIIASKTVEVDRGSVGLDFEAILLVTVQAPQDIHVIAVERAFLDLSAAIEVDRIMGTFDLLVRILCVSRKAYSDLYLRDISSVSGIGRIEAFVCLRKVKAYRGVPLE
jgi:Lrp/AsnC family leucine-responsive transcriptional regulator